MFFLIRRIAPDMSKEIVLKIIHEQFSMHTNKQQSAIANAKVRVISVVYVLKKKEENETLINKFIYYYFYFCFGHH